MVWIVIVMWFVQNKYAYLDLYRMWDYQAMYICGPVINGYNMCEVKIWVVSTVCGLGMSGYCAVWGLYASGYDTVGESRYEWL